MFLVDKFLKNFDFYFKCLYSRVVSVLFLKVLSFAKINHSLNLFTFKNMHMQSCKVRARKVE